jgi:hypothetical protein
MRQSDRQRNPRRTAARADIHDRTVETPYDLNRAQRILQEHPVCLIARERRQAWSRDNRGQPELDALLRLGGKVTQRR